MSAPTASYSSKLMLPTCKSTRSWFRAATIFARTASISGPRSRYPSCAFHSGCSCYSASALLWYRPCPEGQLFPKPLPTQQAGRETSCEPGSENTSNRLPPLRGNPLTRSSKSEVTCSKCRQWHLLRWILPLLVQLMKMTKKTKLLKNTLSNWAFSERNSQKHGQLWRTLLNISSEAHPLSKWRSSTRQPKICANKSRKPRQLQKNPRPSSPGS